MRAHSGIANIRRRGRAGISLVEVLVAFTITLILLGVAVPFFMTQTRAVTAHSGRLDAQLNLGFALDAIERDLRVAGVGVVDRQPILAQVASNALTFNVDLASKSASDFATVYYDPDASPKSVALLWPAYRVTLPNSLWTYPDSAYWRSTGVPSSAETISYWVESDPAASGLYRVMRRANDDTSRVVARGIKLMTGEPFFRYFTLNAVGALVEVPQGSLPIRHINGWHGAPADTAASALTDSIRLVRIKFTGVHRDPRTADAVRVEERLVRISNAGLIKASTCGDSPLAATAVAVALTGTPSVVVTWNKSADDGAGEKDVERYAIYRRKAAAGTFDEPLASITAGFPNYSFTDTDVKPGDQWTYGISAQDCTPQLSPVVISTTPVIP